MYVVATAGHVDHGKSTLVRALTGMEPDRWAEERRRGMTIDLGFAWTTFGGGMPDTATSDTALPDSATIAFVDVPGHERFVPNMLAGIGPVPAVLLVVAADEGWMPQTEEHVAALDALDVHDAVLAVTRSDLADPGPVIADALSRLARTALSNVEAVAVAVRPGGVTHGLDALRAALLRMTCALPEPDRVAAVRLWIDRSFTVQGSGTVVTGTLPAGSLTTSDILLLASSGREVHVRALQSLGNPVDNASAIARVAVNLRGIDKRDVRRGDALLTAGAWALTSTIDVRLRGIGGIGAAADVLPGELMMHVGSAAVPARVRLLRPDIARLTIAARLPLRAGDIALLRDPGGHRVVAGARILDADPPPLRRRGAAAARGRDLLAAPKRVDIDAEIRRRGIVHATELRAAGVEHLPAPFIADWFVDDALAKSLRDQLLILVSRHLQRFPLERGPTVDAVCHVLGLPDRTLVTALVETAGGSPLEVTGGRVIDRQREHALPAAVAAAVATISARLASDPFGAPDAGELARLHLGSRELAAAERAGVLMRVADGVVLLPDAADLAMRRLATLRQPFAVSEARVVFGTTRRVAVPLLELLDRRRLTRRLPDGTRTVTVNGPEPLPEGTTLPTQTLR